MVTSAGCKQAQMHWQALPAARGCAVGRPRRRAAAHPPLRPPTLAYSAPSAHRGAPGAPSRPKSMVTAREDRQEDGRLTVLLAQVVELVGIRDGESPRRAPVELDHLGRVVAKRRSPASPIPANWQPLLRRGRLLGRRMESDPLQASAREVAACHTVTGANARDRGLQPPPQAPLPTAKKEAFQRGRWTPPSCTNVNAQ